MPRSRPYAGDGSLGLADAVEHFVAHLDELTQTVRRLEAENARLRTAGEARAERLNAQVERLRERMQALRERKASGATRRRSPAATVAPAAEEPDERPARGRRVRAAAIPAAEARASAAVTDKVILAVIGKLGSPTAAEIATEITKAGVPVSGRAVRFIAERAGASTFRDEDGVRRYRLG